MWCCWDGWSGDGPLWVDSVMLRGVGYGGSEVWVTGDVLSLKGSADEGSVSFFDMRVI